MTVARYAIVHLGRSLGEYVTRKEADCEMSRAVRAWRYYGELRGQPYPGGTPRSRYSALRVGMDAPADPGAAGQLRRYRLRCNNKPAGYLVLERLP